MIWPCFFQRLLYPTNGELQALSFKNIPDAIFNAAHMSKQHDLYQSLAYRLTIFTKSIALLDESPLLGGEYRWNGSFNNSFGLIESKYESPQ